MELITEKVIVRAYRQEPVRLTAIGWRDDTTLEVCGNDPRKSIGWPSEEAFHFDEGLYSDLRDAYEKRDVKKLGRLWEKGTPLSRRQSS